MSQKKKTLKLLKPVSEGKYRTTEVRGINPLSFACSFTITPSPLGSETTFFFGFGEPTCCECLLFPDLLYGRGSWLNFVLISIVIKRNGMWNDAMEPLKSCRFKETCIYRFWANICCLWSALFILVTTNSFEPTVPGKVLGLHPRSGCVQVVGYCLEDPFLWYVTIFLKNGSTILRKIRVVQVKSWLSFWLFSSFVWNALVQFFYYASHFFWVRATLP